MFTSLLLAVAGMAPTAAVARATSSPVATSFDDTAAAGSALEFSGRGLLTEQVCPRPIASQPHTCQLQRASAYLHDVLTTSTQAGRCGQLCALLARGGVLDVSTL